VEREEELSIICINVMLKEAKRRDQNTERGNVHDEN